MKEPAPWELSADQFSSPVTISPALLPGEIAPLRVSAPVNRPLPASVPKLETVTGPVPSAEPVVPLFTMSLPLETLVPPV